MAYDDNTKELAYEAYREARTIDGAAMLMDIPKPTIHKWRHKYKWDARLEKDIQKIADDPFGEGALVAKRFDFTEQEKQTLVQATVIEGICIACIQGKKIRVADPNNENHTISIYENPKIEELGLKPRSFVEATNTLEKCWKARNEVLSKNTNKKNNGNSIDGEPKENYVEEMKRLAQKTQKV